MGLSRQQILKRVRYSRRVRYGDFAPWEMDDDDPGQAEFQEEDKPSDPSIPKEQKDVDYLVNRYLPEKFGLNHTHAVNMISRYIDNKRAHHDFRKYMMTVPMMSRDIPYSPSSAGDVVSELRRNGWSDANIKNNMIWYLQNNDHPKSVHDHLVHNVRISKITGKI